MNIFAPNYYVQSFKTLNIQKLHEMGIQLLLCDIDNTLVAYDEECPNQDVIDFINKLKMNGIEVAKRLRESGYQGIIVFLTAFREYVFRGYEVRALNYLLKPVKENTLFLCLDEIAKELSNNTYIYRNKQEIVSIPYADILTFSSRLHYVDILTVDGKCYEQMSTLNKIIVHLPSEFIRTHRSYIVNMAHIYRITSGTIELSNHLTTQIARSYSKDVISAFAKYTTRFDTSGDFE